MTQQFSQFTPRGGVEVEEFEEEAHRLGNTLDAEKFRKLFCQETRRARYPSNPRTLVEELKE